MHRVAVVASHPIQYQAPWFRSLAALVDLTVFYGHRQTPEGQARSGFDHAFEWDVPLVDGYRHVWLENISPQPGVDSYAGCDTPQLSRLLIPESFDACIVLGWYLKSYLQAIRACGKNGVPVLVRGDSQLKGPRSAIKSIAKYLPYRLLLRRIDVHLNVGRANADYLRHYGVPQSRLFFAPHSVDSERFAAGADRARATGAAARARQQVTPSWDTSVFAFAGKFVSRKRPADFIEAIRQARARGAAVAGLLIGSGPEESALRSLARDLPVHFAGFQNQSEIAAWYAAADCLVLPSDGPETWGLVVNEAMAAGLPAIVSDEVGCGPDLVTAGETGFVFPVGDVGALADRMCQIAARTPAGVARMRAAVAARLARYSCDAATAGTLAAIDIVTERHRLTATSLTSAERHVESA